MKIAIIDERISDEALRSLEIRGFHTVRLPRHPNLGEAVASHTDMLLTRLGDELISTAEYCERYPYIFTDLSQMLLGYRLSFTSDELQARYPDDAKLNLLVMGKYLFAKLDTVSQYALDAARRLGLTAVPVKQGYPACTVLKLSDKVAVTADCGMAAALSSVGIRVVKIEDGHISLPPYDFGFIGGCAGVFQNTVYFLGDIEAHPSYGLIKDAADSLGMDIVSLSHEPLRDLGGILFIEGNL